LKRWRRKREKKESKRGNTEKLITEVRKNMDLNRRLVTQTKCPTTEFKLSNKIPFFESKRKHFFKVFKTYNILLGSLYHNNIYERSNII